MPLISVNARGAEPVAHHAAAGTLTDQMAAALADLPGDAPLVVMIHGFRFIPDRAAANPHTHILALHPAGKCNGAISWPRHLGMAGPVTAGLAIGFGWNAGGSIWQAYHRAAEAGVALSHLLALIAALAPGRKVDIIAHSLGARVTFEALLQPGPASVGRVILMAGAEFGCRAAAAAASPKGRAADFINITTRENDLFDALLELLIHPGPARQRGLGQGLPKPAPNWFDIQIDKPETLAGLASLGFRIAPPRRRICHWSTYLRPGLFALYRALLTRPGALPLPLLRAHLPQAHDPRWSRLFAAFPSGLPLPPLRNASS